jgi:predicted dehydrogenase
MAKRNSTESPIRIGLVGVGRAGWGMHCSELDKRADKFRIVAAADVDPARLDRMTQRYPGIKTYASIEELAADPDVEVVDIATPSTFHVTNAAVALRAGKDVFLEKPIAATHADAVKLRQLSARSRRGKLYVRHNRRFEPAFQHVREIIGSGLLGDVFEIKLRRHGFQRRDDWQAVVHTGGGQLLNWGPHIIDHGLRLLDAPLRDMWSDLKKVAALGDAEDHLKIILRGTNGRLVDLEISGGVALGEPVWTVYGTRGSLTSNEQTIKTKTLDPKQSLPARRADPGTPPLDAAFGNAEKLRWVEQEIPVKPSTGCDTDSVWDHLHAALRRGEPFPITLDQAVEVMKVADAAKRGTPFEFKAKAAGKPKATKKRRVAVRV